MFNVEVGDSNSPRIYISHKVVEDALWIDQIHQGRQVFPVVAIISILLYRKRYFNNILGDIPVCLGTP